MARLGSFYGVVGVILLLFAGVAYFITRDFSPYVVIHLVGGFLALIAYFASAQGSVRGFLGERSTKYGAQAVLYSLIFFGILILVNYISVKNPHRFDMTKSGIFSVAPQTRSVLEKLDKPLEINAFVEAGSDPELRELLLVLFAVVLSLLQTWIVIELFFMIGTEGLNRFGPDPTRSPPNSSGPVGHPTIVACA